VNYKIEFKALDDVFRSLTDLEREESNTSFAELAKVVELAAKQFCHDEKVNESNSNILNKMGIDFEFTGKRDIDCILRAIENLNDAMPTFLREYY